MSYIIKCYNISMSGFENLAQYPCIAAVQGPGGQEQRANEHWNLPTGSIHRDAFFEHVYGKKLGFPADIPYGSAYFDMRMHELRAFEDIVEQVVAFPTKVERETVVEEHGEEIAYETVYKRQKSGLFKSKIIEKSVQVTRPTVHTQTTYPVTSGMMGDFTSDKEDTRPAFGVVYATHLAASEARGAEQRTGQKIGNQNEVAQAHKDQYGRSGTYARAIAILPEPEALSVLRTIEAEPVRLRQFAQNVLAIIGVYADTTVKSQPLPDYERLTELGVTKAVVRDLISEPNREVVVSVV